MSKLAASSAHRSREAFHRLHRNFFVGLFVLVPAVAIPSFVLYTLGKAEFFQDWRRFHAVYESSYGLSEGGDVTLSDIRVGYVESVDLTRDGRAHVTMKVLNEHADLVRRDSRALLRQKNILFGDWLIALTKGDAAYAALQDGDTIQGEPPMRLDKVIDQIRSMVGTFESILREVDEGKGLVGHMIKDDTLVSIVHNVFGDFSRMAHSADRAVKRADLAFRKFEELGDAGLGVADSLVVIIDSIAPAVERATALLSTLHSASGQLSPLFEQAQTDLEEIELLLKGLQGHWLFRRSVEREKDKEEGAAR
ncbi:MAG: MCE family protein [Chitinivibrionales bacterium]|nr:MCE family protein [Chitinivibrionales bacterium]